MATEASVPASDNGPLIAIYEQASKAGSLSIGSYDAFVEEGGIALVGTGGWTVALVDDDSGTALKVAGKMATLQTDGDRPPRFEGGEHTAIGDNVVLRFSVSDVGTLAHQLPLEVQQGLSLTYGQILALAGDFYGVPIWPIADGVTSDDRMQRFRAAYGSLAAGSVAEAKEILQIMQREIDAVNAALNRGESPADVYKRLGDGLNAAWNKATGGGGFVSDLIPFGRYLKLAWVNWDHFGDHAVLAYQAGHAVALEQAIAAHNSAIPTNAKAALVSAYAMNAFADHYLSDLFSAGHIRQPRREIYQTATSKLGANFCAKGMHDEESKYGVRVSSAEGGIWRAYGDKRYFDTVNIENKAMVDRAVQASATEIYDAFRLGEAPADPEKYAALRFVPDLKQAQDYRNNPLQNFAAMFIWNGDKVGRRDLINRLDQYTWDFFWTTGGTVFDLKTDYHPNNPAGFIAPPTAAPELDPVGWQSKEPIPPDWVSGNQVRYAVSFASLAFESTLGPSSSYITLQDKFEPRLRVPTGPAGVHMRRIYRQFVNRPITYIGTIDDNVTDFFADTTGISVGGLQTGTGYLLTAAQGGGLGTGDDVPIRTDSRVAGEWERFWLEPLGGVLLGPTRTPTRRFALRTADGHYVTAVNDGGMPGPRAPITPIQTYQGNRGEWETFYFEPQLDGTFAIRTSAGFYWTAVDGGGWAVKPGKRSLPIRTNATEIGKWETFLFIGDFRGGGLDQVITTGP
jgi:hypothetical protein